MYFELEAHFLDETHLKINELTQTTLVVPDENLYIIVTDSSSYALYFDMITTIIDGRVLPPIAFSPQDRMVRQANEINTELLIDFITNILSPVIHEFNPTPTHLVLDKANIRNVSKINQPLQYTELNDMQIVITPSQAPKCVNPLDNGLFHETKERIRKHSFLTEAIRPL